MRQPVLLPLVFLCASLVASGQAGKAPAKAAPKAGQPPKAGLASCAGKIEGRYAASNGLPYTIEFRSGKAKITAPLMGSDEVACWTAAKKIYLYMAGDPEPVEIDINDDGTL